CATALTPTRPIRDSPLGSISKRAATFLVPMDCFHASGLLDRLQCASKPTPSRVGLVVDSSIIVVFIPLSPQRIPSGTSGNLKKDLAFLVRLAGRSLALGPARVSDWAGGPVIGLSY